MTTTSLAQSSSDRAITTRRLRFDFRRETVPRYFVDDNIVGSHLVALASATFPRGEDFFVQSVRNYRDRITDPTLKRQVAGFIGQESVHGREHEEFNELLWSYGYPTLIVDKLVEWGLGLRAKLPGNKAKLAMTAALEHYTATFAAALLSDDHARRYMPADEVRQFWAWHALEESEHKAVAFDVYRAVGGSHRLRVFVMNVTTAGVLTGLVIGTLLSMLGDRGLAAARAGCGATCARSGARRSWAQTSGPRSATTTVPTSTPTTTTTPTCSSGGARTCSETTGR